MSSWKPWIEPDNEGRVVIPEGTTEIPKDAFFDRNSEEGCPTLRSVVIPDSVETVGDCAFAFCPLTKVTFGDFGGSVKSVGKFAFAHCPKLTEVTFGDSVKTVGGLAFQLCPNLTEVTLPEGCNVHKDAFDKSTTKVIFRKKGEAPLRLKKHQLPPAPQVEGLLARQQIERYNAWLTKADTIHAEAVVSLDETKAKIQQEREAAMLKIQQECEAKMRKAEEQMKLPEMVQQIAVLREKMEEVIAFEEFKKSRSASASAPPPSAPPSDAPPAYEFKSPK